MNSYKLIARTIQCTADADTTVKWDRDYVGVVNAETPSVKTSRTMWDAIAPAYQMMCGAIDAFSLSTCEWCLTEIQKLEDGEIEEVDSSTDAYEFYLRKDKPIVFEFQFS